VGLVIFGASGHAKVAIDVAHRQDMAVLGVVAPDTLHKSHFMGYPVLGHAESNFPPPEADFQGFVAVGDNALRGRIVENLRARFPHLSFATLVHPTAVLGQGVVLGEGSLVLAQAVLQADAQVGCFALCQVNSSLDHEGILGDFASLAPGVRTGGNVRIGEFSAIGIGAILLHQRQIGVHTVIGAGALVTRDIPDYCVAYGVPAKVIRPREAGESYL
jgi:sugar O-acyltransferase (sialic acid O-acetyltransferase NeuD family)